MVPAQNWVRRDCPRCAGDGCFAVDKGCCGLVELFVYLIWGVDGYGWAGLRAAIEGKMNARVKGAGDPFFE